MKKSLFFFFVGILWISHACFAQNTYKRNPESSRYQTALDLIAKEKYASALPLFEVIKKQTSSPYQLAEAQYYIALCALQLGQENGEDLFLEFIESNPNHPQQNLAYYQLGSYYYRKQKYDKTIEYLSKADLSFLGKQEQYEAEFNLAYAYFISKDLDNAERHFEAVKNNDHKYKYAANYYSGYIKFKKDDYDAAIRDLKVAEQNGVYKQIVPYMIANIYYKKADYQTLISYTEPILKSNEKVSAKAEILELTAESYFLLENYTKAAEYFNLLLETKTSDNREIIYRSGYANLKTGNTDKAINNFKSIANSKDSLGQYASYYLGQSYIQSNNKSYALAALTEASKTTFNKEIQEAALFDVARLHYELEQFDKAIKAFADFDEAFPASSRKEKSQELLSDAYVYSNNYDEAIAYLESKSYLTTKMKENYQQVAYLKGVELFNKKQYDAAIQYFDKSLKYDNNQEVQLETYYLKAEALSKNHRWEEAKNTYAVVFKVASERSLTFLKSRYGIAYAYFNTGDYSKSKEHFSKYTQSADTRKTKMYGDALLRLGDCYYFEKKYKDAIAQYNAAISQQVAGLDYAYYQLGLVYAITDKMVDADNSLEHVEKDYPQSPYRVKASYNRARIAFENGDYQKAELLFTSYIGKYSTDKMMPIALSQRAKAFYNLAKYQKSLADYDRILDEYCQEKVAEGALSGAQQALTHLNKSNEFDTRLSKFEQCNPTNESLEKIRFEAAERNYRASENQLAAEKFNQFITNYPASSYRKQALFYLADAYFELKEYTKSIVYFELVKKEGMKDDYEKALIKLSKMYVETKNYAEAKINAEELLKIATNRRKQADALSTLIVATYNLNSYDSTLTFIQRVVSDAAIPNYIKTEASLYAAKISYNTDSLDKALDEFLYVVNSSTDSLGAEANYFVGNILHKQSEYKQSLEVLYEMNKAYSSYTTWIGESFLLIAENNIKLSEIFQAKATLQSLVDNYPDKKIVEKAKSKLQELERQEIEKVEIKEEILQIDLNAPDDKAIKTIDSENAE